MNARYESIQNVSIFFRENESFTNNLNFLIIFSFPCLNDELRNKEKIHQSNQKQIALVYLQISLD